MKKITIFVHCFPPAKGGLEYLVGEIKKILDQKFEVHVITGQGLTLDSYKTFNNFFQPENQRTSELANQHVHRLELNKFWQRFANKLLNKIIFKMGFFSPFYFGPILKYTPKIEELIADSDIIIGAGTPTKMFFDAYYYANKYHKKLILHPSYHNVSYYNKCYFFQVAFNYASKIIYQTNRELTDLSSNYSINKQKVVQLTFNEYSLNDIKNQEILLKKTNRIRLQHFNNKVITLGFVGQITRRKNLSIFKEYLDQYLPYWQKNKYQIKLLLAGAKTNTSPEIENMFSNYIQKDIVKIIYNFDDKEKVYNNIDIFINPSREESLGIVNFEAIFHGLPIIVDKASAFAEFVPTNIVDLNDIKQLHYQILDKISIQSNNLPLLGKYNRTIYSNKLITLISDLVQV